MRFSVLNLSDPQSFREMLDGLDEAWAELGIKESTVFWPGFFHPGGEPIAGDVRAHRGRVDPTCAPG